MRRLDIQGLRAVAVLLVVAFHAGLPLPGGFVGVDVFFVISGFVITGMLQREHETTGRIRLGAFYLRRFKRLAPALAVVVLFTVLAAALLLSPLGQQQATGMTAIGAMLLFANYAIARNTGGYFDAPAASNPLLHTWTLSLEEQFYLVFPLLLLLGWLLASRLRGGQRAVVILTAGLAAVSFGVAAITATGYVIPYLPDGFVGFYGPVGRAWEFAAGALLVFAVPRLRSIPGRLAAVFAAVGAAALVVSALAFSGTTTFPGPATLLPVIGTVLLLAAGSGGGNVVSRALSARWLTWLGDISYSWYLWHWPLVVIGTSLWPGNPLIAPVAVVLSLAPATASYYWVEQPIRRSAPRRGRLVRLVAITSGVPIVLAVALTAGADNGFWSPKVQAFLAAQPLHAGAIAGCMSYVPLTDATEDRCLWNAHAAGTPIYLIGDSIADHYSEGLIAAAEALDRPLTITTAAGCPPYHLVLPLDDGPPIDVFATGSSGEPSCLTYIDGTLAWLDHQPPGLVIMGAADVSTWVPNEYVPGIPATGPGSIPLTERERALAEGMTASVVRLQAAGHEVMLAKAPPSFRYPEAWIARDCMVWTILLDECQDSRPVEEIDLVQGHTRSVIDGVAADTGAATLDLRDFFCPDGLCSTQRGELVLYLDDIHISVPASEALASEFVRILAAQQQTPDQPGVTLVDAPAVENPLPPDEPGDIIDELPEIGDDLLDDTLPGLPKLPVPVPDLP